jgi:hypothetical protein
MPQAECQKSGQDLHRYGAEIVQDTMRQLPEIGLTLVFTLWLNANSCLGSRGG